MKNIPRMDGYDAIKLFMKSVNSMEKILYYF